MTDIDTRIDQLNDFLAHQGLGFGDAATSTGVVIVAVPRAMEPIRLVGDEDKHATLLFFGDKTTLPDNARETLIETLQNVAQMFTPFSETIMEVSRLGEDNPPALVAMLSNRALGNIRQALLINPAVGELMSNAQQYPTYTPHVTLAYPDYKGEAELRSVMKDVYRIRFDRLSLWWGDEHIDFSLDMGMAENDMAMAEKTDNFLAQHGLSLNAPVISHAAKTVQDVYDGMSPEKKDAMALIIGAAIDDIDLPDDPDFTRVYNSMTGEERNLIEFVVGGALEDESNIQHSEAESLAHFGTKGMRWGVRKDNSSSAGSGSTKLSKSPANTHAGRAQARAQVKAGNATLGTAHLAALKSKGHRAANAFLGDKTYWKRTAAILGLTIAGVGVAFAAPAVMPAGLLAGIGAHAAGTAGVIGGHVMVGGHLTTTVAIGKALVTSGMIKGSLVAGYVAKTVNTVDNTVRAIRGNARINKQYAALGQHIKDRQTAGNQQVQKVLSRNGGIKKSLLHTEDVVGSFLAHQGLSLPNHI